MSKLRRIVLLRHGETTGQSSIRFHGSSDLPLSDEGRTQMREAAKTLKHECFDLVVASPLRRSWEAAWIVSGGAQVRLEHEFCEIDFGRWEGLTRQEIEASDPLLHKEWREQKSAFDFPGGERRADFRARIEKGLGRLQQSGATSALVVTHKGTVRTIAEILLGQPLEEGLPELGTGFSLSCAASGSWLLGRRSSDPAGLAAA